MVALEASKPERVVKAAEVLQDRAYRLRSPGSIAVDLCYVACGPLRRHDHHPQLPLRRRGGRAADRHGAPGRPSEFARAALEEAPLDLSARYDLAAARTANDLAVLREAQEAVYA